MRMKIAENFALKHTCAERKTEDKRNELNFHIVIGVRRETVHVYVWACGWEFDTIWKKKDD